MSGRYVRVDFTTNWGDSLVCPVTFHACDADGVKYNNESMTHAGGPQVNGSPESLSDASNQTYWQTWASGMPNYWKVDLGVERTIFKFKMAALVASRAIHDFTVSVSDDQANWNVILTGEGANTTDEQTWDCNDAPPIAAPVNYLGTRGRDRVRTKGISLGEKIITDNCFSFLIASRDRLRTRGISLEDAKLFTLPFDPASIDGLLLRVAADGLTGKTDGDAIGSWTDLSGLDNHMTQASEALQPLYKENVVNNLPALLFDGSNDFLTSPALTGLKTVVVVAKFLGSTFDHGYAGLITGESGDIWMLGGSGGATWYTTESSGMTWYKDGQVSSVDLCNQWHCFMATHAGKNQKIRTGQDRGNAGWQWHGYVAEIIAYSNIISTEDREALEAFLREKYGIA